MGQLLALLIALVAACSEGAATSEAERANDGSLSPPTEPAADAADAQPEPEPTPTPEGPRPLVVTTLMGENGVLKPLDAPAVAGVAAQIDILNEGGGVLDRPIELRRIDTDSRLSLNERFIDRLIDAPPDLLIVSCDTAFTAEVLAVADEVGIMTISPCASDARYATGSLGPRNFTMGSPAFARGSLLAEVAFERYGATAVSLRDTTNPDAIEFCDGFEQAFRSFGGRIAYRDEFTYDTLEPVRDRLIEAVQPSAMILLCTHTPGGLEGAYNIASIVRNVGFTAPFVAGSTVDEPLWIADLPELGEMTYISWSSLFGNDPDEAVNDLIRRASRDVDTPVPGVSTVLGADAVEAWARAVEAARSADPARVATALASMSNEPLLTGSISFTGGARMDQSRTYRVLQVRDGEVLAPELAFIE